MRERERGFLSRRSCIYNRVGSELHPRVDRVPWWRVLVGNIYALANASHHVVARATFGSTSSFAALRMRR